MTNSTQGFYPLVRTGGITNRIVFQLNPQRDALHYCLWGSGVNDERTEGDIREFSKALRQCAIVHPSDRDACEHLLQAQPDNLTITVCDLRVSVCKAEYAWFRMYTIITRTPQGEAHEISGVLEGLQGERTGARRDQRQPQQDAAFRKAVTSHSQISMGFDVATGNRLVSGADVVPPWLPQNVRLKDVVSTLLKQVVYPEELQRMECLLGAMCDSTALRDENSLSCDCRLPDLSRDTDEIRWYRLYVACLEGTRKTPTVTYLTVVDIQDVKSQEQIVAEQITYDRTTGLLKRCAFEHQVTEWLERIRSEAAYSYVCAVVITMDNAVDMIARQGRAYVAERVLALGKTIKAFVHPHEMCGRYGLAGFAMVLTGVTVELLNERMKILRVICDALNSEWADLHVSYGCNLELASQSEYGDVFLEKAYRVLQNSQGYFLHEKLPFSTEFQSLARANGNEIQPTDDAQETMIAHGKHHIFIRTFGHFDIFVDGRAVLFNHSKAKELLALLVDRRGGFLGATEAISRLWEDEPANSTTLSRCRKAALHLRRTLADYGIAYLTETVNGKRRILVEYCDCDYYQCLRHSAAGSHMIPASYMSEYSWAETTVERES